MKIHFVQTGGTIDKDYIETNLSHGYNFEIGEPAFVSILKNIQPCFEYEISSVMKKDSLDITEDDRQQIFDTINGLETAKIIVTHGTDTILQTATKLSTIEGKKIILTGAFLPAGFVASDAVFNLALAIGALQTLRDNGVYIALCGVVVPWNKFNPKNPIRERV